MNTTMKQGSVVVGVDGSTGAAAALEWAVRHAVLRNRPLLLVNGAGSSDHTTTFSSTVETRRALKVSARRITDHALGVVRRLAPTLDVDVTTPLHDPRQALLELSDRASIMCVGTRGRGPVRSLLLGSVSTAVAEHADCPVAVVRAPRENAVGSAGVVVGVDGGVTSTAALEMAFDLAATQGYALHVVHSWAEVDMFVDRYSDDRRLELTDAHERLLAESLAGYAEKYPVVAVARHIPDGAPVQVLLSMSRDAAALVVGSRRLTGFKAVLGSVSRDLVERAECTVVVAPS
jgi:nucleotide-binding universal stress UspA family protein